MGGPEQILQLSASYRHAFMNQLQVILGCIQLQQPARAEEYISQLRESFFGETRLVRAARPEVAAMLLAKRAVAESLGVEVRFDAAPRVAAFTWGKPEMAKLVDTAADGALLLLASSGKGQRLDIILHEEDGVRCVSLHLQGCGEFGDCLLERLGEALRQKGRTADAQAVLALAESAGGRWESCSTRDMAVGRISWPKEG